MIPFLTILLRLVLALVFGAIIGIERETTSHAAGLRTNALVALGSCLFMIISIYGFLDLLGIAHVSLDPSRVASYVVAGIGFLGGGAIFMSREREIVRGLTTAAVIWLVAAIGLACGAGMLLEAGAVTVLALVVLIGLRYVEDSILPRPLSRRQHIKLEVTSQAGQLLNHVYSICKEAGVTIERLELHSGQETEILEVECRVPNRAAFAQTIGELRGLPGIRSVQADLA